MIPTQAESPELPTGAGAGGLLAPFPSFAAAAREVLEDLHERVGLTLWLVTRMAGDDQVVLEAHDSPGGYGVGAGSVLSWPGSLCAAMVAGNGPHVAPRVGRVPAYAAAPARADVPIEAYVGVPLVQPDGQVFGTLCAFDPDPQPESLTDMEPLVRLQARLLSTVLQQELEAEALRRRAERAESEADSDALTGIANRRGWDRVLALEEARCQRYGHSACVFVLDVDGLKEINDAHGHAAGDELLGRCARVLQSSSRATDYVARLGGDEFGLLATETDEAGGQVELERLRGALRAEGLGVALGMAARHPASTLHDAWRRADAEMYREKQTRSAPTT